MLKNNSDTMTFLNVKQFFDTHKGSTIYLDKEHSIQIYDSGETGNVEVHGKVIAQIKYDSVNGVNVYPSP